MAGRPRHDLASNRKYPLGPGCVLPPLLPETRRAGGPAGSIRPPAAGDVPLPVQASADHGSGITAITMCFGDRVVDTQRRCLIDPLRSISWPDIRVGDLLLVVPQEDSNLCIYAVFLADGDEHK